MRRLSLGMQIFLSILGVALAAVFAVGLIARNALSAAFDSYLASLPAPMGTGPHMGRVMLGGAEQTFIASVDRSVYLAAAIAVVVAIVVALLVARYLTRPLKTLESAAEELAAGELSQRVASAGPTEVAALGDAFNRMADSLGEAEELRRRLVADVSHELRNPVAAARVHAEGMAEGVLAPDQPRLDMLAADLQHLSALVDDLHELAVAEAGRAHYEMAELDLAALVRAEAERAEAMAPAGVTVSAVGALSPIMVLGDEVRLSQVLRNVLTNALRHTDAGRIEAAITSEGGSVEVRVTDTGEGIPDVDLPYVFERFYRADTARAAHTGGAGLGLAIARRIVEDHGGTVFAENAASGGASVGLRLPLA